MEQKKMSREIFWKNSGSINEEIDDYLKMADSGRDDEFSILDQFLTLICC